MRTALMVIAAVALIVLIGLYDRGPTVTIGDATIRVIVADETAERIQGLSGREGLKADEGMWFIFDEVGEQGIWMKDMRFPIDILWLDEALTVVTIEPGVAPETYPTVFTSREPARYVLELAAGTAEREGIVVGDTASFCAEGCGGWKSVLQ